MPFNFYKRHFDVSHTESRGNKKYILINDLSPRWLLIVRSRGEVSKTALYHALSRAASCFMNHKIRYLRCVYPPCSYKTSMIDQLSFKLIFTSKSVINYHLATNRVVRTFSDFPTNLQSQTARPLPGLSRHKEGWKSRARASVKFSKLPREYTRTYIRGTYGNQIAVRNFRGRAELRGADACTHIYIHMHIYRFPIAAAQLAAISAHMSLSARAHI